MKKGHSSRVASEVAEVSSLGVSMTTVKASVTPGARRERFEEIKPGVFDIRVREEAEAHSANTRVRELIARHFGVDVKRVRIVTGHTSPKKTLTIFS